jgi:hypothetical protein
MSKMSANNVCRPAVRASSFLTSERSPAALSMGVVMCDRPIHSPCQLLAVGVSMQVLRALEIHADTWCTLRHPSTARSCVAQLCLVPDATGALLRVSPFVAFQLGLDMHPSPVLVLPCTSASWPIAAQVTLSPVANPNVKLSSHPRYQPQLGAATIRRAIATYQIFSKGAVVRAMSHHFSTHRHLFSLSTAHPRRLSFCSCRRYGICSSL